jgi:hypothetical protein
MIFIKADNNINYPIYHFKSEQWSIGICEVLYGFRVLAGKTNTNMYSLNYCLGDKLLYLSLGFIAVKSILESLPESTCYKDVKNNFPEQIIKPIYNDDCFEKLMLKAMNITNKNIEDINKVHILTEIQVEIRTYLQEKCINRIENLKQS